MARRQMNVFSLSFLDAMTCGFGAVVLFFMVINASAGLRAGRLTGELQGDFSYRVTLNGELLFAGDVNEETIDESRQKQVAWQETSRERCCHESC